VQEILLPHYDFHPKTILEPSAGAGVFVDTMRLAYPDSHITAVDLDHPKEFENGVISEDWSRADESYAGTDFLECNPASNSKYDLIIGNPPYTYAREFISKCLSITDNLVFILRQGFLSSADRAPFFRRYQPMLVGILPNRPSFSGDGKTDSADYCWVCWGKKWCGTKLIWLREYPKELRLE